MKKIFLFLFAALVGVSQVSGKMIYARYATGSTTSMGKIGINMDSSWPTTSAPGSGYIYVSGTSTNVRLAAEALSGYQFDGWYTDASATNLISKSAQCIWNYGSNTNAYAKFSATGGGGGGGGDPSPSGKQTYNVGATGNGQRVKVSPITLPTGVVDLGNAGILWAENDYGTNYPSIAGTRMTLATANSTNFGTGWRLPSLAEGYSAVMSGSVPTEGQALGQMNYDKDNYRMYSPVPGFEACYLQLNTAYKFMWIDGTSASHYYLSYNEQASKFNSDKSNSSLHVRLVYDLSAMGIKKLTIVVDVDGVKTANVYYCASGQQVQINPQSATGYDWKWDNNSTSSRTFTVSSQNTVATLYYTKTATPSTVTFLINPAGYGTVSRSTIENIPNPSAISVNGSEVTIAGTTVGAYPEDGGAQYEYTFTGWSNASGTVTEDRNITANFTRTTLSYPVTFYNYDGSVLQDDVEFEYGSHPTYNGATPAKPNAGSKKYTFAGWKDESENVYGLGEDLPVVEPDLDSPMEFTAVFNEEDVPQYTVTISTPENGTLTVKNGGTTISSGATVPENTVLTITATPASGYKFGSWANDGAASVTVTSDVTINATFVELTKYNLYMDYTVDGIIRVTGGGETYESSKVVDDFFNQDVLTEGVEYTFTLVPDAETNGWGWWYADEYYDDIISSVQSYKMIPTGNVSLYALFGLERVQLRGDVDASTYNTYHETMVHEVEYVRTFKAKTWSSLWLPFDVNINPQGLSGILYELNTTNIEKHETYVNVLLNFHKMSDGIINAGTPCLFYSKQSVENFVFHDVMFTTYSATKVSKGEGSYAVDYYGTNTPGAIGGVSGGQGLTRLENRSLRYLSSNALYYPNEASGSYMESFRGYFKIVNYTDWYNEDGSMKAPRMRIIADGEEIEEAEQMDDMSTGVTKYIENGVLIIERNGVKYLADGAVAE